MHLIQKGLYLICYYLGENYFIIYNEKVVNNLEGITGLN